MKAICHNIPTATFDLGKINRLRAAFVNAAPKASRAPVTPAPCRCCRRAHRGLHGDLLPEAGDGLHPQGRSAAEDGAGQLFCFAMQSRPS
jgi:hypothetical protein